jgi:hypothetical protein
VLSLPSRDQRKRSIAVLLLFALASSAAAATVSGRVELVSSHDPNVRKHTDYSGVVAWLEPARR